MSRTGRFVSFFFLGVSAAACAPRPVFADLAETYTTHGLTEDLRAAAPAYVAASRAGGYEVVWIGVAAEEYKIEQGPNGPRKVANVTALARRPADGKCYGRDGKMVRVNQGGDTYGPPVLDASLVVSGGTPADLPDSGGFEYRCSAIANVQGGLRFDSATAAQSK